MNRPTGMIFSRLTASALLLVLLASCATTEGDADAIAEQPASETTAPEQDDSLSTSAADLAEKSSEATKQEAVVYKGTDRHVRMPQKQQPVRFVGEDVSLNFEQAPLSEVTHAIMGDTSLSRARLPCARARLFPGINCSACWSRCSGPTRSS